MWPATIMSLPPKPENCHTGSVPMQHLSLHLSFPIYYTGNHLAQPYLTINHKSAHCQYLLPNNDFFFLLSIKLLLSLPVPYCVASFVIRSPIFVIRKDIYFFTHLFYVNVTIWAGSWTVIWPPPGRISTDSTASSNTAATGRGALCEAVWGAELGTRQRCRDTGRYLCIRCGLVATPCRHARSLHLSYFFLLQKLY